MALHRFFSDRFTGLPRPHSFGQIYRNNASVSNDLIQFPVSGANCSCDIGLSAHGVAIENVENATRIGMIELIDNPDHTGNKSIGAAIRPVVAVQGLFEGCFRRESHHHPPGPDWRQPSLSISSLKSSGGRGALSSHGLHT